MKKQKYKEQYKTCIFLARCTYYTAIGDNIELARRILNKTVEFDRKKVPLFDRLYGTYGKINKIGLFFMDWQPSISMIFKVPFINHTHSMNPKKAYQIWCREFDNFFTKEEIQQIIDENLSYENGHDGPGRDFLGESTWNLIQEQNKYIPFVSEIKWLYNRIKYGKFFVED